MIHKLIKRFTTPKETHVIVESIYPIQLARERVKSPPLFGIILPLNCSRAAVWVCADTYPGMTLCESLPYDMVDTTIVGY